MTRRTASPKSPQAVGHEGDGLGDLLARYGCGPVRFTGTDDALYERRLVFDHVLDPKDAGLREQFEAVAAAIRDVLSQRWVRTQKEYDRANPKQVYYLSMEFLIGRSLANNITNLMLSPLVDAAARDKGLRLAELIEQEPDAGLGNGGLGRLAACFIDSLATMAIPADRVRPPLRLRDLPPGDPRRLPGRTPRPLAEPARSVGGPAAERDGVRAARLAGSSRTAADLGAPRAGDATARAFRTTGRWSVTAGGRSTPSASGRPRPRTSSISASSAAAISSARCRTGSSPRRSAASSTRTTRRPAAGRCGSSRNTSSSPAPWPTSSPGSSAAGTTGRRCRTRSPIQLNDTHPAMAVAELMRILLDQAKLGWDEAWDLTVRTLAYTNHTLLPEALEKWPVELFEVLLPRQLEIIYEINRRFLDVVRATHPGDEARVTRMSLIEETPARQVRMANLAIVGTPQHQRGGGHPLGTAPDQDRGRFRGDVPRSVQQQDQRRHPPALAAAGQPGPGAIAHRSGRRGLGHGPADS